MTIHTKHLALSAFRDSIFGDGSDGDVTISSNTSLTRAMYYDDLTVNVSTTLTTAGCPIYVKGTLTLNGTIANNGEDGSGATSGGLAHGVPADGDARVFSPGSVGADGQVGTGGSATTGGSASRILGGAGGSSGSYDSTGTGITGAGTLPKSYPRDIFSALRLCDSDGTPYAGGLGGGASNGYDDTGGAGTTAGAGGGGGGVVAIYAKTISISGTGEITANGGNGGGGTHPFVTGGGGGGGGAIIVVCAEDVGSASIASAVNVSRGEGGVSFTGDAADGSSGSDGNAFIFTTG